MAQKVDLTVILCLDGSTTERSVERYRSLGSQFIVIFREDLSFSSLEYSVISYDQSIGKVAAINAAILQAKRSHILWLEEGESIPRIPQLDAHTYCTAQVRNSDVENPMMNRQIRMFPNVQSDSVLFDGFEIPDIYRMAERMNWRQADDFIHIDRAKPLFRLDDIEREAEYGKNSPVNYFWQGMRATQKEQFAQGIDYFKQSLNLQGLPAWNELAALNSLANNYIETHQLGEAKITAELSLEISQNQRAPYLTLYQAYNYSGETNKAYETLVRYSRVASDESDANWDVYLPQAQAAFLMAQIALKQGKHKKAYRHYEQFYVFNNGGVSEDVLEKLFLYAVELQDRAKAIQYFEALFGNPFPQDMTAGQSARIREALALFSDKGWYDYASKIYQQLVSGRPEDETLRNGLIRVLVKNNEISKAQALL